MARISLLCAVAVSGCGGGRGAASPTGAPPAVVRQATHSHEVPSPPAPPERVSRSAATAAAAVREYAQRYINWNAGTVAATLRELALASVGQARSALALEAAQVASDPELAQNGIANSGSVEAVAALAGSRSRYVVVTRERTSAQLSTAYRGLRPAWHVTIAAVAEVAPGRWVVSGWQPEN